MAVNIKRVLKSSLLKLIKRISRKFQAAILLVMIYCRKKLGDNNLPRLFWDENDCNGNIINYFSSATVFPTMAAVLYSKIGLQLSWPKNWCTVMDDKQRKTVRVPLLAG